MGELDAGDTFAAGCRRPEEDICFALSGELRSLLGEKLRGLVTETAEEAPEAGDIIEVGVSSRGGIIRGVGTGNSGLGDTSTDADFVCLLIAGCWKFEFIGVLGPATTMSESTEVTPG